MIINSLIPVIIVLFAPFSYVYAFYLDQLSFSFMVFTVIP